MKPVMHRQMKVLVLDPDDRERARWLDVLSQHATPGEFQLFAAASALEALVSFTSDHPDLILIGVSDIENVGREVCRRVRETEGQRHTGIIFLDSRSADDSTLSVECLEMGADDFLRNGCTPAELLARVKSVLRLKSMTDELRSANHRLRILSMTDELTGLANMRSFNQQFSELMRLCRRGETALAVMMLDLDHFKAVNDTTNHLIGSFVIAEAGRLIRQKGIFGDGDVAARYGGDEFIVVCPAADVDAVRVKAEKLRQVIEAQSFEKDGCAVRITASIGVAWTSKRFEGRAEDIIKAADLMLYRSKSQGRNCVSCMVLRYPVDLENVSRTHLVEEDAAGAAGVPPASGDRK